MAEKNYASPGSRIVAIVIDTIILGIIGFLLMIPFGLSTAMLALMSGSWNIAMWMIAYVVVLNFIIWIIYFTYFEGNSGQTIGKKAMHIKVVKNDGKKLTYADALIRTILRVIDGIAFYLIGLIVILVTERKQRIGDMAAGTIVVKA